MSRDHGRFRWRGRAGSGGGAVYDADAQIYINTTGELFPTALNTLVLGIKAAGLWDNHVGSIKKAIGVPSLAASMIDLRNTAFNGTAVNTPGHSATAGWTFTAASSQYIDGIWAQTAAGSKASQNSVHVGVRARSGSGGGGACAQVGGVGFCGFWVIGNGSTLFGANTINNINDTTNPTMPSHMIGVRPSSNSQVFYRDGSSVASNTEGSLGVVHIPTYIGCNNTGAGPATFFNGRMSLFHAGAALDASQVLALTTLFNAYAAAAGET